jgi:hypothetical protein
MELDGQNEAAAAAAAPGARGPNPPPTRGPAPGRGPGAPAGRGPGAPAGRGPAAPAGRGPAAQGAGPGAPPARGPGAPAAGAATTSITSIVDRIIREIPATKPSPDTAVALLREIAEHTDSAPIRRNTTLRFANALYDGGSFSKVLTAVEQYELAAGPVVETKDLSFGMLRALALIQLDRLDEALQKLSQMSDWPGSEEDHGRAQFLVGWINLQQDHKDRAVEAFKIVVSKYGRSTFAEKAQSLLKELNSGN